MPVLSAKVDVDGPLKAFQSLRQEQIPFVIARALTMTAGDARDATRNKETAVFHLRNDWTTRRTLTKMATKQNLTAEVYTDTENRRTGAPDYMPLQDDGGVKVPSGHGVVFQGKALIAVPTDYLKRIIGDGVMPAQYRPQNLMPLAFIGQPTKGQLRRNRTHIRMGMYYFIQNLKSGALCIFARNANDPRDAAIPLYVLVTRANVRGRQVVDGVVFQIVEKVFPENFSKAATEVMANDLLRGSGVSVRL